MTQPTLEDLLIWRDALTCEIHKSKNQERRRLEYLRELLREEINRRKNETI